MPVLLVWCKRLPKELPNPQWVIFLMEFYFKLVIFYILSTLGYMPSDYNTCCSVISSYQVICECFWDSSSYRTWHLNEGDKQMAIVWSLLLLLGIAEFTCACWVSEVTDLNSYHFWQQLLIRLKSESLKLSGKAWVNMLSKWFVISITLRILFLQ